MNISLLSFGFFNASLFWPAEQQPYAAIFCLCGAVKERADWRAKNTLILEASIFCFPLNLNLKNK